MTAVEWYTIELKLLMVKRENGMNVLDFRNEFDNLSEQANKMFEQQIIDAAMWMPEHFGTEFLPELGKQYYNKKFKDS